MAKGGGGVQIDLNKPWPQALESEDGSVQIYLNKPWPEALESEDGGAEGEGNFDLNSTIQWEDMAEDVFDLENPIFWEVNEEDMPPDEVVQVADVVDLTEPEHANLQEEGNQEHHLPEQDGQGVRKRRFYSDELRREVYMRTLEINGNGYLKRGVSNRIVEETSVDIRFLQRLWKRGQEGGGVNAVGNWKAKVVGHKRVELSSESVRNVPLANCTTLKDLAAALNMSVTTVWRRLKEGKIRRHSNAIKYTLTGENKMARVQYCLSMFQSLTPVSTFCNMYNVVHIDEKWFYRTRGSQKFYLAADEENPERTCKNKNFIEKVMFLAAVARPWYNDNGFVTFTGKIRIFPFTFVELAKRSSAKRPAGTLITKAMTSVTKEISREFLVHKVLPAIKQRWPFEDFGESIIIQQDNAKTHIAVDDEVFCRVGQEDGFNIRLMCQPPNFPDLNVLDLGFFAGIQALFQKGMPNNIDDIVTKVTAAYDDYPVDRLNRVFLTHQSCMKEILRLRGEQHYDIPHMRKQHLERIGELPVSLTCDASIVGDATKFIT